MKRYNDMKLQAAHENACDCLYFGFDKNLWCKYDLDEDTANKIWAKAKKLLELGDRY